MYTIKNVIDGKSYVLHSQRAGNLKVIEPRLSRAVNKTGALTFRIPEKHEYYKTIRKLRSSIEVYEDNELIYEGRPISDETDFYNTMNIVCEGSMSYLQDSKQRPFALKGTIDEFLREMVRIHNESVEERKRFQIGIINVADRNNEFLRENTSITNTWNVLKKSLLDISGGMLWVSYQNGNKVLNYTYDMGGFNEQKICFGENLLDLTKYQDAANIITCLIPYGADVEYTDELGEKQKRTIDITTVNGGKDYVTASEDVLNEYGKIWGTQTWKDIIDPDKLLEVAENTITESSGIPDSLKIKAIDLNYAGIDVRRFQLGKYTTCISKPHAVKKDILLTQLDLYLDDPVKGSITLGSESKTFTGSTVDKQASISKNLKDTSDSLFSEMLQKIQNATTLITGGFGGYVVLDNINPENGEKMHPWRILIMNAPDKQTAKNIIQINQNGIGFSTTGIDGPYRNAWTIDGNLVADFVTAGTMLADRIRGGTLEVGGAGLGKNGVIRVLNNKGDEIVRMDINGITINQGKLNAPIIVGGTADFGDGLFYADDEEVCLGGFYARYGWGRDIFQSMDGQCGLSSSSSGKGKLWMWAGYNSENDYDFLVNNGGQCWSRDFCVKGFGSITEKLEELESRIDDLEAGGVV